MVSAVDNTVNYNYQDLKGGGFKALMGSLAAPVAILPISTMLSDKMCNIQNFSNEDILQIKNAAKQILDKHGLTAKGVTIKYLPEIEPPKDLIGKLMSKVNVIDSVKQGKNAFFTPKDVFGMDLLFGGKIKILDKNTICMPENKIQGSVLHEIGHAHSFNKGGFLKLLQKVRPVAIYLPVLLTLYGAFSKKSKPTGENQELTKKQKANNFIRDNAGILSFISMLPILAEEAAATIKGKNFAKEFLSKDIIKKATKANWLGFSSYVLAAVASAIGAAVAVKIKDKAIEKKEEKLKKQLEVIA